MKIYLYIINFIIVFFSLKNSNAQQEILPLNKQVEFDYEAFIFQQKNIHSCIKPYIVPDSIVKKRNALIVKNSNLTAPIFTNDLYKYKNNFLNLSVNPYSDYTYLNQKSENFSLQQGVVFKAKIKQKLLIDGTVAFAYHKNALNQPFYDSLNIVPHFGSVLTANENNYYFPVFESRLTYLPSKYFTLQIGKSRNFIGDGYYSLILSDNANSYPYFKANAKVWNFNYFFLINRLQDIDDARNTNKLYVKHSAAHFLSWNVFPKINLYFFETVVWSAYDSAGYRGVDVNYLNPFVFFRPIEANLGSPDNSILGGGIKIWITKRWYIYGQAILDEFHLMYIKQRNKYWGNKYGIQMGSKVYDLFWDKSVWLGEINIIRPYTYSHHSTLRNYGNYLQPMAHPLGANFYQATAVVYVPYNRFRFTTHIDMALVGFDNKNNDTLSYGQDIYKPYFFRPIDSGVKIAQGEKNALFLSKFTAGYLLNPKWNLTFNLSLGYQVFIASNEQNESLIALSFKHLPLLSVSLKTTLFNENFNQKLINF